MTDLIDLRASIEADLAHHKESLKRWETGRYAIAEIDSRTGERRDLTEEHIQHLKRIIAELERVLAHFDE